MNELTFWWNISFQHSSEHFITNQNTHAQTQALLQSTFVRSKHLTQWLLLIVWRQPGIRRGWRFWKGKHKKTHWQILPGGSNSKTGLAFPVLEMAKLWVMNPHTALLHTVQPARPTGYTAEPTPSHSKTGHKWHMKELCVPCEPEFAHPCFKPCLGSWISVKSCLVALKHLKMSTCGWLRKAVHLPLLFYIKGNRLNKQKWSLICDTEVNSACKLPREV